MSLRRYNYFRYLGVPSFLCTKVMHTSQKITTRAAPVSSVANHVKHVQPFFEISLRWTNRRLLISVVVTAAISEPDWLECWSAKCYGALGCDWTTDWTWYNIQSWSEYIVWAYKHYKVFSISYISCRLLDVPRYGSNLKMWFASDIFTHRLCVLGQRATC